MTVTRFDVDTFPYNLIEEWETEPRKPGNQGTKHIVNYVHPLSAFDIETSRDPATDQSFMYVWQWAFEGVGVLMGRTWAEYVLARDEIEKRLKGRVLVVLVHNLSYEFQFLRAVHSWQPEEVFAVRSRRVAKAKMGDCFEFRCTYIHSNMNLATWTKKMKVKHQKLDGERYRYDILRFSDTPLTEEEIKYCCNDVLGCIEAYRAEMDRDGDYLSTIPLTSTGYVRRDVKRAMHASRRAIQSAAPSYRSYQALKEAFRGGLTHANRYYVGVVLHNVQSFDRSSSYPDVLCNSLYPVTKLRAVRPPQKESDDKDIEAGRYMSKIAKLISDGKAVLLRAAFYGLELRDQFDGFPYLSWSKCRHVSADVVEDNGRILSATYLETTITDIDFRIIMRQYKPLKVVPIAAWWSHYGYLPRPLVQTVIDYYKEKTELKDKKGSTDVETEMNETMYTKSKNLLNGIYGLMAQDPVKHSIIFDNTGKEGVYWKESTEKTDEQLLKEATYKMFTLFQWGCWCTAWARFRLMEGVWLAEQQGADVLYVDTDSVKYMGDSVDWTAYNNKRVQESKKSGAFAEDVHGVTHYMGVYERERGYKDFTMLRAKCYAFIHDKEEHIQTTIAGVSKKMGGPELEKRGGLPALQNGFTFYEAAGLEAVYNDDTPIEQLELYGHAVEMGPNVCLRPSTYRIDFKENYIELLEVIKNGLTGPGGVSYN